MSNLENTFKLLFRLRSGVVVKKHELAEELHLSDKQVLRCKKALEEFFTIESIPGPSGGYRLMDSYFPFKELLNDDEILLLKYYAETLEYIDDEKLKKALGKINYSILRDNKETITEIIPYSKINNSSIVKDFQNKLYEAVLQKSEVIISYKSNQGIVTRRRIQPLKIFVYKGESYVAAMCLVKNDIRFFKLVRIKELIVTSKKFEVKININKLIKDSMENCLGIFSGQEYKVKLKIYPPMSNTISERIWVNNQRITELEDGSILLEAEMKGGPEIISWILSMRSFVEVLEPETLKTELRDEANKIINNLKII